MKEKIKEIFGGGEGGRWGSLLLNHPHDGVISALWLKDQYLISSPATNNNLASNHGHTQSDMRKKTCQPRILYPEVMFQKWRKCSRNEEHMSFSLCFVLYCSHCTACGILVTPCCYLYTKSCLTLCNPTGCSPLGSSVHGISQTRILEWVAISFSRGPSQPRDWTHVSCNGRQILYCPSHQGNQNNQSTNK